MAITPASIRNRNPGAMYPGPSSKRFGSTSFETLRSKDGVHKIATFPTSVHGGAALFHLLAEKYTGQTIEKAIATWCGGYYVSTYLQVLEAKTGTKPSAMLSESLVRDPVRAIPIARAMAWQEAGRDYPMTDDEWAKAHEMAFSDAVAPAFAPDNDVPSPKPETRAAALVAKAKVAAAAGTGVALPAAPDLSGLQAWKAAVGELQSFVAWAGTNWRWALAAAVVWAVVSWWAPKLAGDTA